MNPFRPIPIILFLVAFPFFLLVHTAAVLLLIATGAFAPDGRLQIPKFPRRRSK